MTDTPTPKPGELWATDWTRASEKREDGWYWPNGERCTVWDQTPISLVGYTAEYVTKLRDRLAHSEAVQVEYREQIDDLQARNDRQKRGLNHDPRFIAERDEAVARAEAAEVALTDLRAESKYPASSDEFFADALRMVIEREPWRVLRSTARVYRSIGADADARFADQTADRLEREHAETAKRDRLIGKLESATREAVEKVAGALMHAGLVDDAGREALVNFDFTEAIGATAERLLAEAGCGHPNHGGGGHDCSPFTEAVDHD